MINFTDEILPGGMTDQAQALASIRRINAVVSERNAMLMLTQDPEVVQQIKLAPEYYD